MFPDDYPLLNRPGLVAILMRAAEDGPADLEDCMARLEAALIAAHESPRLPADRIRARFAALSEDLRAANLLEDAGAGRVVLTDRGHGLLARYPDGFDTDQLMIYPEYQAHIRARNLRVGRTDTRTSAYDEGFIAALTGARLTENPYTVNTVDHQCWENGWAEAQDESIG